jgi:CBS domain-containing protein/ribosome-associated translation inhibitor RaiA
LAKTLVELAETRITELLRSPGSVFSLDDQASKVLGFFKDTGRYEAAASGGGRAGIVTVRDLLGVDHPERTRVESIWEQVGTVDTVFTVIDVAETLIEKGVRALPVVKQGEVEGIISQVDLLGALAEVSELKSVAAKDIMMSPVVTLNLEDGVAQARSLMLDRGISHIPVLGDGKLKGIITAETIVHTFITPASKTKTGDRVGEKVSRLPGQVSGVMDRQPLKAGPDANVLSTAKEMTRLGKSACVIVDEEDRVLGIITPRELLQLVYDLRGEDELPVYIVGITGEDFFERAVAEEKLRRIVVKSMRMQPGITEVRVNVKKQRTQGERPRYSLTARVLGPEVSLNAENDGWGLMEAFDGLVSALDKVLSRAKKETLKKPRHGRRRPTREPNP